MAQEWQIDGPKVLDVGSEDEVVRQLRVGIVGGRLDVVTHDDSPAARLEVHEVVGRPLQVTWDGSTLKVAHVKEADGSLWEGLLQIGKDASNLRARISLSIPSTALVRASTVSADALITGVRNEAKVNTVSGVVTLDDIIGDVDANTVSGEIECHALNGDFTGNSVSGCLTVLASDLQDINLNTVSGDIALDLADGEAKISSNSVSGDVTVRVPQGRGYDVRAQSVSGQVIVDGTSYSPKEDFKREMAAFKQEMAAMKDELKTALKGHKKAAKQAAKGGWAAPPPPEPPRPPHPPTPPRSGGRLRDGDGALQIRAVSVSGDVIVLRADADPAAHGSAPATSDRSGG
jgi:hypothetical protein